MAEINDWEAYYASTKPEDLPWNAGGPDPDLIRLVQLGRIPVGQALDLGTGPGHDAVYLIQKGFNLIGIDLSPTAVKLARENASNHGLFGFFQQGDIRRIPVEDHFIDFVYDRGCFHTLDLPDRPKAMSEIYRVLKPRGHFFLRVFSDKEPGTDGPHRFSRKELETLWSPSFQILELRENVSAGPRQAQTYGILMEKK